MEDNCIITKYDYTEKEKMLKKKFLSKERQDENIINNENLSENNFTQNLSMSKPFKPIAFNNDTLDFQNQLNFNMTNKMKTGENPFKNNYNIGMNIDNSNLNMIYNQNKILERNIDVCQETQRTLHDFLKYSIMNKNTNYSNNSNMGFDPRMLLFYQNELMQAVSDKGKEQVQNLITPFTKELQSLKETLNKFLKSNKNKENIEELNSMHDEISNAREAVKGLFTNKSNYNKPKNNLKKQNENQFNSEIEEIKNQISEINKSIQGIDVVDNNIKKLANQIEINNYGMGKLNNQGSKQNLKQSNIYTSCVLESFDYKTIKDELTDFSFLGSNIMYQFSENKLVYKKQKKLENITFNYNELNTEKKSNVQKQKINNKFATKKKFNQNSNQQNVFSEKNNETSDMSLINENNNNSQNNVFRQNLFDMKTGKINPNSTQKINNNQKQSKSCSTNNFKDNLKKTLKPEENLNKNLKDKNDKTSSIKNDNSKIKNNLNKISHDLQDLSNQSNTNMERSNFNIQNIAIDNEADKLKINVNDNNQKTSKELSNLQKIQNIKKEIKDIEKNDVNNNFIDNANNEVTFVNNKLKRNNDLEYSNFIIKNENLDQNADEIKSTVEGKNINKKSNVIESVMVRLIIDKLLNARNKKVNQDEEISKFQNTTEYNNYLDCDKNDLKKTCEKLLIEKFKDLNRKNKKNKLKSEDNNSNTENNNFEIADKKIEKIDLKIDERDKIINNKLNDLLAKINNIANLYENDKNNFNIVLEENIKKEISQIENNIKSISNTNNNNAIDIDMITKKITEELNNKIKESSSTNKIVVDTFKLVKIQKEEEIEIIGLEKENSEDKIVKNETMENNEDINKYEEDNKSNNNEEMSKSYNYNQNNNENSSYINPFNRNRKDNEFEEENYDNNFDNILEIVYPHKIDFKNYEDYDLTASYISKQNINTENNIHDFHLKDSISISVDVTPQKSYRSEMSLSEGQILISQRFEKNNKNLQIYYGKEYVNNNEDISLGEIITKQNNQNNLGRNFINKNILKDEITNNTNTYSYTIDSENINPLLQPFCGQNNFQESNSKSDLNEENDYNKIINTQNERKKNDFNFKETFSNNLNDHLNNRQENYTPYFNQISHTFNQFYQNNDNNSLGKRMFESEKYDNIESSSSKYLALNQINKFFISNKISELKSSSKDNNMHSYNNGDTSSNKTNNISSSVDVVNYYVSSRRNQNQDENPNKLDNRIIDNKTIVEIDGENHTMTMDNEAMNNENNYKINK